MASTILLYALAASTPQTLDLTTLQDPHGNALTVTRSRYIAFKLLSSTDGQTVKVGNYGSNDFLGFVSSGGTVTVYPSTANNDGFTVFSAPNTTGMAVDGTHKNLKLDPGSTAASLLVIVGTSSV